MITFRRTVSVPLKNVPAGLAFAREAAGYVKSKFGVEVGLQMPMGGNPWRFCFVSQYDSLASLEQTNQKMMSDPKYMELSAKASDIYIIGSAVDEIWTHI